MPFPIEQKLVVAVASSALFDLTESDAVFRDRGTEEYRKYQRDNENKPLDKGVAFPFIERLLSLNGDDTTDQPIEVILLSKNDPDTGNRVFRSIAHYQLVITRAAFTGGRDPSSYIEAFNASLFLSANDEDVREAIMNGYTAGRVLASKLDDDPNDHELRIAFDFDGVLIDDEAERVFKAEGLAEFHEREIAKAFTAHNPGPLKRLLAEISQLQRREIDKQDANSDYQPRIRTAIITARSAPSHERLITTFREWGIRTDETFFLGGMNKNRILRIFRPHIFFDDQMSHAGPASGEVPSVHVPFGVANELARIAKESDSKPVTDGDDVDDEGGDS